MGSEGVPPTPCYKRDLQSGTHRHWRSPVGECSRVLLTASANRSASQGCVLSWNVAETGSQKLDCTEPTSAFKHGPVIWLKAVHSSSWEQTGYLKWHSFGKHLERWVSLLCQIPGWTEQPGMNKSRLVPMGPHRPVWEADMSKTQYMFQCQLWHIPWEQRREHMEHWWWPWGFCRQSNIWAEDKWPGGWMQSLGVRKSMVSCSPALGMRRVNKRDSQSLQGKQYCILTTTSWSLFGLEISQGGGFHLGTVNASVCTQLQMPSSQYLSDGTVCPLASPPSL